jgi:hypothetical protein
MITASIEIYSEPKTIADVRAFLAECELVGLEDHHPLLDGMLSAILPVDKVETIECWNHIPDVSQPNYGLPKDLLVALHDHADESRPE